MYLGKAITERVQPLITGGRGMPCVRKWHPTIADAGKCYGVDWCYGKGGSREKSFKTWLGH